MAISVDGNGTIHYMMQPMPSEEKMFLLVSYDNGRMIDYTFVPIEKKQKIGTIDTLQEGNVDTKLFILNHTFEPCCVAWKNSKS